MSGYQPFARTLWTLKGSGLTTTLTTGAQSDLIDLADVTDVILMVYAADIPAGTLPTLDAQLDVQDVDGHWFPQIAKIAQISAQGGKTVSAGLHMPANAMSLPKYGRLAWTVGGTNPSFTNVSISLTGR